MSTGHECLNSGYSKQGHNSRTEKVFASGELKLSSEKKMWVGRTDIQTDVQTWVTLNAPDT